MGGRSAASFVRIACLLHNFMKIFYDMPRPDCPWRSGRGGLFCSAAAGAAVFRLDARFVFPGEEGVHREIDLAEDLTGAFRACAAHRRAGLRRNTVIERRNEQLRIALEPDDGELPDGDRAGACTRRSEPVAHRSSPATSLGWQVRTRSGSSSCRPPSPVSQG